MQSSPILGYNHPKSLGSPGDFLLCAILDPPLAATSLNEDTDTGGGAIGVNNSQL
jgi:hypothetical protein